MKIIDLAIALMVAGIVACGLLIAKEVNASEYWTCNRAPTLVSMVLESDMPCGRNLNGCWIEFIGAIVLRTGLKPSFRACVESHERKHAAGCDHPIDRPQYATDCGDGTIYP